MEIRWGSKTGQTGKGLAHIPNNVLEDAAQTINREKRQASAIDEIIANSQAEGAFDNLEGKGKPLNLSDELTENYYLHRVMKNANVLPDWLELQHQIRDEISRLADRLGRDLKVLDENIDAINVKITKFNRICPSSLLRKPMVTRDNLTTSVTKWE